jgi:hypothetical protein
VKLFERQMWPIASGVATGKTSPEPRIDIRERMRGMWR